MKFLLTGFLLSTLTVGTCFSGDWSRFRGPNGSGVAADSAVPTEWSDDTNLKWKADLPGPGGSSPIVVGDNVFVTCYTGYGDGGNGSIEDLQRHLLCIDRSTGDLRWQQTVDAILPEDEYRGMGVPEHGYATHTPVSDGERVYVFYGKSGVYAYDMEGSYLWDADLGRESGPQRWGSAASPILFGNLLIVNASEENEALYGLNTESGSVEWKAQAAGLGNTWGTPIVVEREDGAELVIGVPNEIWGFNPESGKLRWYASTSSSGGGGFGSAMFCSSLVSDGENVYGVASRGGGAAAVRVGGNGDVSDSHVVWNESASMRFTSPVLHEGHLYSVSGTTATCINAETGETVKRQRLSGGGGAQPQGGGGGRRGGGGGRDYTSPILADGKLIYVNASGTAYVIAANPELDLIAENRFISDTSRFIATPAASDGQLFIRSDAALYCVAE